MMKNIRMFVVVGVLLSALTLATPSALQDSIIRLTPDGWLVGAGNRVALLLGSDGKGFLKISETGAVSFLNSATLALPAAASIPTPVITAPNGATSTGLLITKSARFVEAAAGTSYTATVAIPAGAVIHDITLIAEVLWNGTSATAKVGDTADDDGYFTGVDLKATDLLVNEVLSVRESGLWGGKEGAYLVAATGRRGPTTTNFGLYYAAGSNITCIITPGAADGTAGRTVFSVTYSVGEVLTVVVV